MNPYLAIFLLIDVFILGVVATIAWRHALAHFRPEKHDLEHHRAQPQGGHLPPALREQLIASAQTDFQAVLKRSSAELQKDLESTAGQIQKELAKIGSDTAAKELEHYKDMLVHMQQQTEKDVSDLHQTLDSRHDELKAKLTEEIAAEKQHLLQQIDTKLADAVSSFLLDTLQHNVDLGAQTAYLTSMLEEHKDDFKNEVGGDDAEPAS
ncbi:MAG TPA: hypothetical protein VF261_00740 [Candidatus Saccharimonadales bacterium]